MKCWAGCCFLRRCLAGLVGSGLVLLHLGLVWLLVLFRVTSLSLFARICTRFLYRWTWSYRQSVFRSGWLCQVDIRHKGTVSGDVGVYFIDCVRMEVFSLKQSGKDDFWVGESVSCFFHDSSEGIRHSVLLAPQVIGARVDDNVAGMAQLRFG